MGNVNYIKIEDICVKENRVTCIFSVNGEIKKFFNENLEMFIEYKENIEEIPKSILVIPFIANIMPLIWLEDGVLWVREVDRRYYDAINRIKSEYQDMYSWIRLKGKVIVARTVYNEYKIEREAIQLFSGGLDAITTNIRIKDKNPILVNIYGWNNKKIEESLVFEAEKKIINDYANRNNQEIQYIQSNFATFIKGKEIDKKYGGILKDSWWHGLQHGSSFISHAIPIAYKNKVRYIYISSSNYLGKTRVSCSSDPAIDIEIKYASGEVIHDGFELNRQEKIRVLVEDMKKRGLYKLKVCSFTEKNCCICEKCFRTILGLVTEGISQNELKEIGFEIKEVSLKKYYENYMRENLQFFGVEFENRIYWNDIKKRAKENSENIKEKEFIEWFNSYDFLKNRKNAILKYRVKNFIQIVKRKMLKKI